MKILIVEDNEALAQTTGWIIEMLGYDYRISLTPQAALTEGEAYDPDVVMMDIGLPGMSGYDLCRQMRQKPAHANAVFVAQTGWDEREHREQSAEAGFVHHLTKPVDLQTLESVLNAIAADMRV
ncbi:response regulator [Asticcacaulis excentricus]|uniref:Response regulator receiver protein n=1 Tax=Asticcacaulis excentricus (strain ATCC 15261 / DSM 4724 / KCTC 12464 / NCIMB 9791 / VKM B-1370 / CB 48) TaxID=573065 RepID=E8RRR1_ASTEC|nr:response regulator [Asticcacaulis excentricus]ADU12382.1 response regulator receiver protein [Asticcacaulis excentricus CB 48]